MRLFKKFITLSFLVVIPGINADSLKDSLIIYQKIESLLKESCGPKLLNPVIISNDLKDIIYEISLNNKVMPMILVDSNFEVSNDFSILLPELLTYVLSTSELEAVLRKMKSASWWNIESRFFIVDISENACDIVGDILQIMSKNNLLTSLFICKNNNNSVGLYTYNPYANYAPYPWQRAEITANHQEGQWTPYVLLLDSYDTHNCSNLFFVKTNYLNGSKITVGGVARPEVYVNYKEAHPISSLNSTLDPSSSKLFLEIVSSLNVTPIIYYTDLKVKAHNQLEMAFIKNLTDGTCDMVLNELFITSSFTNISYTYPINSDKVIIITKHKPSISPFEEIGSTCSLGVILFTVFVLIITFIVIMLCKKPGFGFGLLEILRMTLSISTLLRFYRDSLRIFIAFILLFIVIMNANFQSRMTAYSAKIKQDVVNSIEDLQNLKYEIYMKPYAGKILGVDHWLDEHKKYVHIITSKSCYKYIIEDQKSIRACITSAARNLMIAIRLNLHVALSEEQRFSNFQVRKDWPLKNKVDCVISHLTEGGILKHWQNNDILQPIKKLKLKEVEIFDVWREIIMSDLYYIFLIFGICLSIGFIMFIVEIVYIRIRARIR